jgi:glutathione S-transferase
LILYEHPSSGNCLKARVMLDQVGAAYERVQLDLFAGETRTPEHFARNPDGRIPVLELDSGEFLAESGAILLYLGEGTQYLPDDPLERARVHAWMFFEQNQVEANLGVARFLALSGRAGAVPEVFADRQRRGRDALATLERGLEGRDFVCGAYSVADLALYGYVHAADDAGVPLAEHPAVAAWVERVGALPGFEEPLAPMPAHARERTL